jgi:hypothetical protein
MDLQMFRHSREEHLRLCEIDPEAVARECCTAIWDHLAVFAHGLRVGLPFHVHPDNKHYPRVASAVRELVTYAQTGRLQDAPVVILLARVEPMMELIRRPPPAYLLTLVAANARLAITEDRPVQGRALIVLASPSFDDMQVWCREPLHYTTSHTPGVAARWCAANGVPGFPLPVQSPQSPSSP